MKIVVETPEGKASVYRNDIEEDYTWIELAKAFSSCLKSLEYCPTKLDKFLEEVDTFND